MLPVLVRSLSALARLEYEQPENAQRRPAASTRSPSGGPATVPKDRKDSRYRRLSDGSIA